MKSTSQPLCLAHHPCMEWEVYVRLRERYRPSLDRARDYLSKKRGRPKSGGTISSSRRQTLLDADAQCPLCGENLRDTEFNTEHIHARGLGGLKTCDETRIAMCIPCNDAKNGVMQLFLPKPNSKYQTNCWPMVEGYLLWSELTADEGLAAGALVPMAQEQFLKLRFQEERPLSLNVYRAYGRFSTWLPGDEPNHPNNTPTSIGG